MQSRNTWDVPKEKLDAFLSSLDKKHILDIIITVCKCKDACGAPYTYRNILEARAEAVLGAGIAFFASLLVEANDESRREFRTSPENKHLLYLVKRRRVCRTYYRSIYSISHRKCNIIRKAALGDTRMMQFTPPKETKRGTKTKLCEAFWGDFLKSLAPSPVDGLLLWRGRSRKLIYAIDFVEWFLRTQENYTVEEEEGSVSTGSTGVNRTVIPVPVGGDYALPSSAGLEEKKGADFASQRKHSLFDELVDSDSDKEDNPDIPPSLQPSMPSFSLFCK